MKVCIGLLRGVNVGGRHQIKMEALRALCEGLGLCDAQTYLQSGNVVFRSPGRNGDGIGNRIGHAIAKLSGFRPEVMLRSPGEMADVVARNPFAARPGLEPAKLAVLFLASEPSAAALEKAARIPPAPEEFRIAGREVYIYFPNGMGRPKLSVAALERALGSPGTARNWNTVTKLAELGRTLESA
jgi:uncharacterized protein (DUF1697 family)